MTPYRGDEQRRSDRLATRWHAASSIGIFLLLAAAAVFAAILSSLTPLTGARALLAVFMGGLAVLVASAAERSVHRVDVTRDRILVREGYLRRKVIRSISLAEGAEVRVTPAAGVRFGRNDRRGTPYIHHLVEVHTPHGSWVILETDDGARANAMAEFVRSSLPPR